MAEENNNNNISIHNLVIVRDRGDEQPARGGVAGAAPRRAAAPLVAASDLHEAILANAPSVVKLLLTRGRADPNVSPQLAPIGVIAATANERARELHRSLGRVFRSRPGGTLCPLHVAVCNAYHSCASPLPGDDDASVNHENAHLQLNLHHDPNINNSISHSSGASSSSANINKNNNNTQQQQQEVAALEIVQLLLTHGADATLTCHGISFCRVGDHPSVAIASSKTADKVALFLKRFPPPKNARATCRIMDQVATMILSWSLVMRTAATATTAIDDTAAAAQRSELSTNQKDQKTTTTQLPTSTTTTPSSHSIAAALTTWTTLLHDTEYADVVFICPDDQRVMAHKAILAAAVPYFQRALQGPWKEAATSMDDNMDNDNNNDDINSNTNDRATLHWRTSHSANMMKRILKYIYTGQVDDMFESNDDHDDCTTETAAFLSVASEYQLDGLVLQLQQRLIAAISHDSIVTLLQVSHHMHHDSLQSLQDACHSYVHDHASSLLPLFARCSTAPWWNDLVEALEAKNQDAERSRKRQRMVNEIQVLQQEQRQQLNHDNRD